MSEIKDWTSSDGLAELERIAKEQQKAGPYFTPMEYMDGIPALVRRVRELEEQAKCGVCAGFPNDHPSGLPCICGGSGLAVDEALNARKRVFELEAEVARLRRFRSAVEAEERICSTPHSIDERHGDNGWCSCREEAALLRRLLETP